jgi:toxin-antitoxin system PIN domain toxin
MIILPDVNVLIFLADPQSPLHEAAKSFFQKKALNGWATCPMTENGFMRIIGHPSFPGGTGSAKVARETLLQWQSIPGHQFWADDVSLCDTNYFPTLAPAKHLTDCYLLALAVKRGGKFATFDQRIDPAWVRGGHHALLLLEA